MVSGLCGKFPDCLETFRILWNVSGLSEKLPDDRFPCLESFLSVFALSGEFPECLESFSIVLTMN